MRTLLVELSPFQPAYTPISLGGIGAVLQHMGHEVRLLSLGSTSRFSVASFGTLVRQYEPRLVGFSSYQRNIVAVLALARLCKQVTPEARIVLGGPQATFLPDEAVASLLEVDFVARGEGELVIRSIANAVESAGPAMPLAGVTTRGADGEVLSGASVATPDDLDDYPSPWLSGILDPSATDECVLLSSRGCPHRCAFCYTPAASGRRARAHSVDRVLEEIAYVAKRGSGRLWFADPDFSFDQRRVVAILEGIVSRSLGVELWLETRADMLTRPLATLMRRAGVTTVAMGLESASPHVLRGLDKRTTPEQVADSARVAFECGLDVELFSQYALPGESFEDALATLRWVQRCGVAIRGNTNAQQMQLYFGSAINSDPARFGIRALRRPSTPFQSVGTDFETDWLPRSDIDRVRDAWRAASADGGKRIVS